MASETQIHGKLRRSPGKCNSSSAVAVVVDNKCVVQFLRAHDKARWPVGAQTNYGSYFTVCGHMYRGQSARSIYKRNIGSRIGTICDGGYVASCGTS